MYAELGHPKRAAIIQTKFLSETDLDTEEEIPKLVLNEDDDTFFRSTVVEAGAPITTKESHKRIRAAYDSLLSLVRVDALGANAPADRLSEWVKFLSARALVITVEVPSESDAFMIFETLNDRGADLTIADLLKNYLFRKAGSRLETVKAAWTASLAHLDISSENELFVAFLRQYWSSLHGATRERDLYRGITERVVSEPQAVDFALALDQAARLYAALLSSSHDYWSSLGATSKENVETLLRLELEQHRPLLLAVMAHFPPAEIRRALRSLVSWSVRGLVVGGIGGGSTEKAYCAAAVKIRAGEIQDSGALFEQLSPIIPSDETFREQFATARVTKAKVARYILNALERRKAGRPEPELVPNANEEQVNLEHVFPKNARSSDWPAFPVEEYHRWVHQIGNFALLSKGPNGRIGNKPFSAKQPVLAASELALTKEVGATPEWTMNEILDRQRSLAKLAVLTWPRKI